MQQFSNRTKSLRISDKHRTEYGQTQTEAISVFTGSNVASYNGSIESNTCASCAMDLCGHDLKISRNVIHDWFFGGGITTKQDVNCYDLEIVGNTIFGGSGIDANAARPCGIENNAKRSVISGNTCHGNRGAGIAQGGSQNLVTDNLCYDNGFPSEIAAGILLTYAMIDSTAYSASESIFSGNRCFNTNGVSGLQSYGLTDSGSGAGATDVTLGVNDFTGNNSGEMLLTFPAGFHGFLDCQNGAKKVKYGQALFSGTSPSKVDVETGLNSVEFFVAIPVFGGAAGEILNRGNPAPGTPGKVPVYSSVDHSTISINWIAVGT